MDLMARRRVMLSAGKPPRLPREYQEVEYLESTGTQWIDTGLYCHGDIKITVKVIFPVPPSGYFTPFVVCGAFSRDITNQRQQTLILGLQPSGSNNTRIRAVQGNVPIDNGATTDERSVKFPIMYDLVAEYKESNKTVLLTDKSTNVSGQIVYSGNPDYNLPIFLFARNNNGNADCQLEGKIITLSVISDGTLTSNFVPCYRKADHKPGMFDLVTKTFFTNQGSGEFLVGPDVN